MSYETYEYKKVNVSNEPKPTIEATANRWGAMGWRVVTVIPGDHARGFADVVIVERSAGRKRGRNGGDE